jgi:hypothetical protein
MSAEQKPDLSVVRNFVELIVLNDIGKEEGHIFP